MSVKLLCPYCGKEATYHETSVHIYSGIDFGPVYDCRPCDAYVGINKQTGLSHGTLANRELRQWRRRAHKAFDPLWKIPGKTRAWQYGKRTALYKKLAQQLGLSYAQTHIGMFDIETCKKVEELCRTWRMERVKV